MNIITYVSSSLQNVRLTLELCNENNVLCIFFITWIENRGSR